MVSPRGLTLHFRLCTLHCPERAPPPALTRLVRALFIAAVVFYVLAAPTAYAHLHRYASGSLLFTTGLVLALWVVASLLGPPLRYVRSGGNVCLWLLLALLLFHVMPLPRTGVIGQGPTDLGPAAVLFVNGGLLGTGIPQRAGIGRFSIFPGPALGVLIVAVAAAGLYWLVGAAVSGRKVLRAVTWAAVLGLAPLAAWVLAEAVRAGGGLVAGAEPGPGLVPVLGGDSLLPALLAALPMACALVLRPLGGLVRRPPDRRQSRFGWILRPGAVWAGIGILLVGLIAAAIGASHVRPALGLVCLVTGASGPLLVHGLSRRGRLGRRPAAVPAVALAIWVVLAWALGQALAAPRFPPSEAEVGVLHGAWRMRDLLGFGAGSISPRAVFGQPGWPRGAGLDGDTSGYRLLAAEVGWAGLGLAAAFGLLAAGGFVRALWRARGPWPRLAALAGLGALVANALYFACDATALLVPNLMALAIILGLTVAWGLHGATWRRDGGPRLGRAHWPFVVGAVGMAAALGVAETGMLGAGDIGLRDKIVHFGTFAVISLLVCYALDHEARPKPRWLTVHAVEAVLAVTGLGVGIEMGQLWLTAGRSFEWWDIGADALGAAVVGLFWWMLRRGQVARGSWEAAA